jgi:tRNA pseudouridine55 synthase
MSRRSDPGASQPGGLVIVDKPAGWTSHDVVGRMRRLARTRRVGHAGTLDPMATGVLVLGVARSTRLLTHLSGLDKAYTATVRLGQSTSTDDASGEPGGGASAADLAAADVESALASLRGTIAQRPSAVSAIKIDGKRAYRRVRDGEDVQLAARPVTVHHLAAAGVARPRPDLLDVDIEVECSSGTYIRALARDLGADLGVGGHLTALRRTRVGPFGLADARSLAEIAALDDPITLPLADAVRATMPVREVDAGQARALSYGQALATAGIAGTYAAVAADGTVIALLRDQDGQARPVLVFTPAG